MNIAFTQHASEPGITMTFDIETAVFTLAGGEAEGVRKLRALATLLDIEIPKGLKITSDGTSHMVYDGDRNALHYFRTSGPSANHGPLRGASEVKAAYIAHLIEERVKKLEEDEREARYAYANNI